VVLSGLLATALSTVPVALLVLPPAALVLVAGLGLWWSGRHAAVPVGTGPEALDRGSPVPDESVPLAPRALGAYVRTLEETLAEQDARLHECRRAGDQRMAEQQQLHQDRVRLTLRAMRDVLHDQPGAVALNRVERALDRLHEAPTLTRPLLAAQPSGSAAVSFALARSLADEEQLTPVASPTGDAPERRRVGTTMLEEIFDLVDAPPDARSDAESDVRPDDASSAPTTALPPEMQRVLPVPAPPVVATRGRRSRRRLRRRTAVSSP